MCRTKKTTDQLRDISDVGDQRVNSNQNATVKVNSLHNPFIYNDKIFPFFRLVF